MNKYLTYIKEFQGNNPSCIFFVENQLAKHLEDNPEDQTEIEHILDYIYSTNKTFKIGYKTIKEKADKWNSKLQNQKIKDTEKEGVDYEVVKKWRSGFKMVKLISKDSYNREGKTMSHCVSSYYGKDDEIYSLRDKKNMPHCTLSKNSQQIKGKGNGDIHPDYIKYVVEFLEYLKIDVRDSEMKNLGYVNIETIKDKYVDWGKDLFRKKYFPISYIDKIKDKEGNKYQSLTLWNNFKLIVNNAFNFNFNLSINTFIDNCNKKAGRDSNTLAGRNYNTLAGLDSNTLAGRNSNTLAGRDSNTLAGLDSNTLAGRDYNTLAGLDSNTLAGRDYNTFLLDGKNNVGVGRRDSIMRGKIGSLMIFVKTDENYNVLGCVSAMIDGKKIKEDTFYCLKGNNIVETELSSDQREAVRKAENAMKLSNNIEKFYE